MVREVYGVFGFNSFVALSTRPEKFIGTTDTWDEAEHALRQGMACNSLGRTALHRAI